MTGQTDADFRSDTLTRPDAAMRQAMAEAVVGDDVFGEDPTIHVLEEEAAEFLGKAAALFVPSGTMANQIAIHGHCRSGDELLCEDRSHVFLYEAGAVARWSGTQCRTFSSATGFGTPEQIAPLLRDDDPHQPASRLLVIENSHNMAGGRVLPPAGVAELVRFAHAHQLRVHVDGARVVNAAVAAGVPVAALLDGVDSVSMCFSKGLGAPVGSVVAGSEEFIRVARRTRKAFGGGMRQVGVLGAAALLALREGPARLALDHQRALDVATAVCELGPIEVDLGAVETNILMVDTPGRDAQDLLQFLAQRRILAMAFGPTRIRMVFHRDLTDDDVQRCIEAMTSWAEQYR